MKTIILNTTANSGTHTMLYLFGCLAGIPIYWEHFEPGAREALYKMHEYIKEFGSDDLVFLQTYRGEDELIASYRKKHGSDVQRDYVTESIALRHELLVNGYPLEYLIPIDASPSYKTLMATKIFIACDAATPESNEVLEFMDTWPKLNSQLEGNDRGLGDKWPEFRKMLNDNRFKRFFEIRGVKNGCT